MTKINIEDLKKVEIDMLNNFINVCNILKLKYFLVGGSCLGAVRHKGFIPWDDDIDVALPRPDYDKFIEVAQQYLPDNLFLQNYKTEPDYRLDFAKIRNSDTTFIESENRDLCVNKGIYIDVFPIDGMPTKTSDKKLLKLHKFIAKKYLSRNNCRTTQSKLKWLLKKSTIWVFCLLNKFQKPQKVLEKLEKHYKKFTYSNCDYVVCHGGAWGDKEICPKEQYGKGKEMLFENERVIVPEKTDEYLTHKYGDYMKFPPKEKQISHHYSDIIDTEKSYIFYI